MQDAQWYVAVDQQTVGPVSTDQLMRGLASGKVPVDAFVCPVGAQAWQPVSSVEVFVGSIPPPVNDQEPAPALRVVKGGALPSFSDRDIDDSVSLLGRAEEEPPEVEAVAEAAPSAPQEAQDAGALQDPFVATAIEGAYVAPQHSAAPAGTPREETRGAAPEVDAVPAPKVEEPAAPARRTIDSDVRELGNSAREIAARADELLDIDVSVTGTGLGTQPGRLGKPHWDQAFAVWCRPVTELSLPPDPELLSSLHGAPDEVLIHQDGLWNLALCLAYGSDAVAYSAAIRFFEVVTEFRRADRVGWMVRTLLGCGFLPSGIDPMGGERGVKLLEGACPEELRSVLTQEIARV